MRGPASDLDDSFTEVPVHEAQRAVHNVALTSLAKDEVNKSTFASIQSGLAAFLDTFEDSAAEQVMNGASIAPPTFAHFQLASAT